MVKMKHCKGELAVEEIVKWTIAFVILVTLLYYSFKQKDQLLSLVDAIGNVFRFGK